MARKDVRIIRKAGETALQIFVDGVGLPEQDAAIITRNYLALLGQGVGSAVALTSAIEGHRGGGLTHAHVTGGITNDR